MNHGGDLTAARLRHGTGEPAWLDLSTGINPHPWPVPAGLRHEGWTRLPSRADLEGLEAAARNAYGVPASRGIAAAPGTQALIQWLPYLAPAGPVAVVGPTYGEHASAWRAAGSLVAEIADLRDVQGARHVVVVNPNNPDGRVTRVPDLVATAEGCRERGGWLVVDESFADTEPACSIVPAAGNLPIVVLRSFGKFYGLAGLRLGFAVAPPEIAAGIARALGPWAVSAPAIAAGTAALADAGWARDMNRRLAQESAALDELLDRAGLDLVGGTSLFRLARVDGADAVHERLAARHIWTRRFTDAPGLLRFGLPPDEAARSRLREALHAVLDHDQGTTTGRP